MMQGDAYNLGIRVLNNAGSPVAPDDIINIEITVGGISKNYLDAQLSYVDGLWMFPLTQQDTFRLRPAAHKAEVRIVWANGVVEGKPVYGVRVHESISKEVL